VALNRAAHSDETRSSNMAEGRGGETETKHTSDSVVTAVSRPGESTGLHGSRGWCKSCQGERERPGIVPVHYTLLTAHLACLKQASPGRKGSMALKSETPLKAEQMKGLPSVNKLF